MTDNITFIPFDDRFKIFSEIKGINSEKELSYQYDGKSYIKYPIGFNKGVLTVSNNNLIGFIISSKRGLRMENKQLQRASISKIKEISDGYVYKLINHINKNIIK